MSDYRIVPDSVGGTKCLVVYRGDKPLVTVWDDGQALGAAKNLVQLFNDNPEIQADMQGLVQLVHSLGGGYSALQGALTEYFKSKVDGN